MFGAVFYYPKGCSDCFVLYHFQLTTFHKVLVENSIRSNRVFVDVFEIHIHVIDPLSRHRIFVTS